MLTKGYVWLSSRLQVFFDWWLIWLRLKPDYVGYECLSVYFFLRDLILTMLATSKWRIASVEGDDSRAGWSYWRIYESCHLSEEFDHWFINGGWNSKSDAQTWVHLCERDVEELQEYIWIHEREGKPKWKIELFMKMCDEVKRKDMFLFTGVDG